jgi:TRAP transporter T-component
MHDYPWIPRRTLLRAAALAFLVAVGSGCASMVASATSRMAQSLSAAVLNQDDPETVRQGAPAYLLLVDSLIADDPHSSSLLQGGARLYVAYAAAFVIDPDRARRLTRRAVEYADRALCEDLRPACAPGARTVDGFKAAVSGAGAAQVPVLYTWGVAHAGWIQAASEDWNAIAELPKVEAAIERVVELDETYEHGAPHVYLGILATLRPAALGGRPAEGRRHFERAIALSDGKNLMAQVQFARYYARLVFDRPLHDRLLNEVLAAEVVQPGLTLSNTLAQEQARKLLADADKYF